MGVTRTVENWPHTAVLAALAEYRQLYGEESCPKQLFVGQRLWAMLCEAFDSDAGFNFSACNIPIKRDPIGILEPNEFIFSSI